MKKAPPKELTKEEQDEVDRNWYKNLKVRNPVGKSSIPKSAICRAVYEVMVKDGRIPAKRKKN